MEKYKIGDRVSYNRFTEEPLIATIIGYYEYNPDHVVCLEFDREYGFTHGKEAVVDSAGIWIPATGSNRYFVNVTEYPGDISIIDSNISPNYEIY